MYRKIDLIDDLVILFRKDHAKDTPYNYFMNLAYMLHGNKVNKRTATQILHKEHAIKHGKVDIDYLVEAFWY